MEWISAKKKLPNNCFQVAVLMWNQFNDMYEYGIGIYDIPTASWEITPLEGNGKYDVNYWVKLPEESQICR